MFFFPLSKQVVLRDGRNLVGVLRSFDQYSNMVLEDTYERHVVDGKSQVVLKPSTSLLSHFFSLSNLSLRLGCDMI